jgi:3-methylornithyl-N6-L-lysine dehydrogenase
MTRLREEWIRDIENELIDYDKELKEKTGLTLLELAAYANGIGTEKIIEAASEKKAAVIPITAGEGIIGTFSESIAAILRHMGMTAFVTKHTDAAGIYEAHQAGAVFLFFADDERFIGCDVTRNLFSENDRATAVGYIAALEKAVGNIADKKILLLGYGRVGHQMLPVLIEKGAIPKVYDIDLMALRSLDAEFKLQNENEIREFQLILDVTNKGDWIQKEMLHDDAWISAPGVPLSLDKEAYKKFGSRLIHDCLQLGTAVMMGELCK